MKNPFAKDLKKLGGKLVKPKDKKKVKRLSKKAREKRLLYFAAKLRKKQAKIARAFKKVKPLPVVPMSEDMERHSVAMWFNTKKKFNGWLPDGHYECARLDQC
jgi:hypothetical protein